MTESATKFWLIGRMVTAYGNAIAAFLEKVAAEMSMTAKSLPEREYWRGYTDAMQDAKELNEGERA